MNSAAVLAIFKRFGAIITDDHIVYTSGRHGSAYINKDALYPHTEVINKLCHQLALQSGAIHDDVEIVIAPALGGIVLSQWVAHYLSNRIGYDVLAIYAEKSADGKTLLLNRGYDKLVADKQVLVVEDILTTGESVRKVVQAVREHGGHVIGVNALINRGGVTYQDVGGVPHLTSLADITLETWSEDDCPLCKKNAPINTSVGKGMEFLERRRKREESLWICDGCGAMVTPAPGAKRPDNLLCPMCHGYAGETPY